MSKRRITKQQQVRIQKLQQERRERALKKEEKSFKSSQLGPEQQGVLVTHYGKHGDVEFEKKIYRCHFRQNLGTVVVGDNVIFRIDENKKGIIVAVCPRSSLLWHVGERDRKRLVAANIDQMIIVIAPQPEPTPLLIDSYLVAAEYLNLMAIILFNKIDLFEDLKNSDKIKYSQLQDMIEIYKNIGYHTIQSSAVSQHGIDDLENNLMNHRSVFIGQSGVGKSALINKLLPHEALITGELHEATGLGRHTTTTSRLYHLPQGGELIDSPGIREFGLWEMKSQEIARGFKEFQPLIEKCKFRNCRHMKEPDCAITRAVQAGKIQSSRWNNYSRLINKV